MQFGRHHEPKASLTNSLQLNVQSIFSSLTKTFKTSACPPQHARMRALLPSCRNTGKKGREGRKGERGRGVTRRSGEGGKRWERRRWDGRGGNGSDGGMTVRDGEERDEGRGGKGEGRRGER